MGYETCEGCANMYGDGYDDDGDDDDDDDDDDEEEEEGQGGGRRRRDAGDRLFKTRTQHHRMVGKKT